MNTLSFEKYSELVIKKILSDQDAEYPFRFTGEAKYLEVKVLDRNLYTCENGYYFIPEGEENKFKTDLVKRQRVSDLPEMYKKELFRRYDVETEIIDGKEVLTGYCTLRTYMLLSDLTETDIELAEWKRFIYESKPETWKNLPHLIDEKILKWFLDNGNDAVLKRIIDSFKSQQKYYHANIEPRNEGIPPHSCNEVQNLFKFASVLQSHLTDIFNKGEMPVDVFNHSKIVEFNFLDKSLANRYNYKSSRRIR
jgi:hypothetical protein